MSKKDVEWVRLDDVTVAADRGIAPLGPEFAGFVVLEAAMRVRDLGGGIVDASTLAIGTNGHVALTAQPRPASEASSTQQLRVLLGGLLAVASSTTQALRKCARRRDAIAIGALIRELEAALVPLNRAASRRGVARVARETLEAIEEGRLEVGANDTAPREPSASPAPVQPVAVAAALSRPSPPPLPEPEPTSEHVEDALPTEVIATVAPIEPVTPPAMLADMAAELEAEGDGGDIEIVSQLPPIVAETPREDSTRGFALAVDVAAAPRAPEKDRVAELVETFEVSRRRDDPALSRDLKAMVGIETSVPPPVAARREEPSILGEGQGPADPDRPSDAGTAVRDFDDEERPRRRRGRAPLFAFAIGALGAAVAATAARPSLLDAVFGPPLPPPGDLPAPVAAPPAQPASATPRLPVVCEASLTLEGAPAGAEVLRRLGATPTSVAMPMHVALDLVATLDGHAPRRAHVDASTVWAQDATAPRLDVSFPLEAKTDAPWPAATGIVPMRAPSDLARGLLRATSTPSGATLWVVVDPSAIHGVPCGAPVDLRVVTDGASKDLRVEWSAFTGSPPRAAAKL